MATDIYSKIEFSPSLLLQHVYIKSCYIEIALSEFSLIFCLCFRNPLKCHKTKSILWMVLLSFFMSHIKDCSFRGMDASKPELFLSICPGQTIKFFILLCYQLCSYTTILVRIVTPRIRVTLLIREEKQKREEEYFTFL